MINTLKLSKIIKDILELKKFDDIDSIANVVASEYARQMLFNPESKVLELQAALTILDNNLKTVYDFIVIEEDNDISVSIQAPRNENGNKITIRENTVAEALIELAKKLVL